MRTDPKLLNGSVKCMQACLGYHVHMGSICVKIMIYLSSAYRPTAIRGGLKQGYGTLGYGGGKTVIPK